MYLPKHLGIHRSLLECEVLIFDPKAFRLQTANEELRLRSAFGEYEKSCSFYGMERVHGHFRAHVDAFLRDLARLTLEGRAVGVEIGEEAALQSRLRMEQDVAGVSEEGRCVLWPLQKQLLAAGARLPRYGGCVFENTRAAVHAAYKDGIPLFLRRSVSDSGAWTLRLGTKI